MRVGLDFTDGKSAEKIVGLGRHAHEHGPADVGAKRLRVGDLFGITQVLELLNGFTGSQRGLASGGEHEQSCNKEGGGGDFHSFSI